MEHLDRGNAVHRYCNDAEPAVSDLWRPTHGSCGLLLELSLLHSSPRIHGRAKCASFDGRKAGGGEERFMAAVSPFFVDVFVVLL